MNIPQRITTNINPNIIEDLGNGNWYYNYDIKSEIVQIPENRMGIDNENSNLMVEETQYNFIQIKMYGKPTYKKCVELIIRQYITQSQEFDLINSANKSLMAGNARSEDLTKYQEYLDLVDEIKTKVANDLGK